MTKLFWPAPLLDIMIVANETNVSPNKAVTNVSASFFPGAARASDPAARVYETLDGLRGIAALAVVIWHMPNQQIFPSAFMAVDIFFMLSGFVLAYRYDGKLLTRASAWRFTRMRVIRLYPLYLLGSALGGLLMLKLALTQGEVDRWIFQLLMSILMIPIIAPGAIVFPFNTPAWSLFYELWINILYGFSQAKLRTPLLVAIILFSALLLAAAVENTGHMRFTGQMPLFLYGVVRTIFGFSLGVLLFRAHSAERLPQITVPPILILTFMLFGFIVPQTSPLTAILTLSVTFALFPIVLILGINNEPHGVTARIMKWLGLISFPLYAVHFPIVTTVEIIGSRLAIQPVTTGVIGLTASFVTAWLALRLFDIPVRRLLSGTR